MKKNALLNSAIAMMMSALLISGCSSAANQNTASTEASKAESEAAQTEAMKEEKKFSVVSTIFPSYDWVKEVIGDRADSFELTLLLDKGTDLHSYQPTAEDIAKISKCDLFIYVGGESDYWVADALKESTNPKMQVINLVESIGDKAKEEEIVEGMEGHDHDHDDHGDHDHESHDDHGDHDHESHDDHGDHDHESHDEHADHDHESHDEHADHDHESHDDHADHDHDEHADHDHEEHADHDDHDHDHEHVVDEHVWLSLENAKLLVATIEKALGSVDAENAALYQKNAQEYIAKLAKLDEQYEEAADSAKHKHIVFGDRFPFRYLADDYDIEYHAAFVGCSAETEASFETVAFLANKVDELGVPAVLTIEKSNQKIAKTIIENTESKNQEIKVMNSLQSVTSADIESGVSYLSVMEQNLEVLKQVLN